MIVEQQDRNRRVLLLQDVNPDISSDIIKAIVEISIEDGRLLMDMPNYQPEPITLIINSPGGSVYDGLGIIGAIETSVTPVHTVCFGSAMSMGLFILAAGHIRSVSRYATLMYHEMSTMLADKLSEVTLGIEEAKRLEVICDTILTGKTKFKQKELDAKKKKKSDWYFDAEYAKKKGLVDNIL